MLSLLRARAEVLVFDRAPLPGRRAASMLRQICGPLRYFAAGLRDRNHTLYLGLSGGLGQVVDALYLLIARAAGRRVFVHHHSFAYVDRSSLLYRCTFLIARSATHIVLSKRMGDALRDRYRLDASHICVLSNAAFFEPPSIERADTSPPRLRLGFLSNVSPEKGLVEFFQIVTRLRSNDVSVTARIAGPISPEARSLFDRLMLSCPDVEYVGPVYGEQKQAFYRNLDIFIFPSRYHNEAEPLVLHEAMRSAVYPIATRRGAIEEVLADGGGLALAQSEIVVGAADCIEALSKDSNAVAAARSQTLERAKFKHRESSRDLLKLLDMLTHSAS